MKIQNPSSVALPLAHPEPIGLPLLSGKVFFMQEIWKEVPGYEGYYSVSNLGNVKSHSRLVINRRCLSGYAKLNEKMLNPVIDKLGYGRVILHRNTKKRTRLVHQLVASAFLNHIIDKYTMVVNHIDLNPRNNRVDNLEIVTQRQNANLKQFKHSSKYTGVSWFKDRNKWRAYIWINGRHTHLGLFTDEYEAHLAYENALNHLNNI